MKSFIARLGLSSRGVLEKNADRFRVGDPLLAGYLRIYWYTEFTGYLRFDPT